MGDHRGIADVSMDGSECSPVAVFQQALPPRGWGRSQGTSMATAIFAGLAADAAQVAGHRLGLLGPALYSLHGTADGRLDVTEGTDSMPGIPGWPAGPDMTCRPGSAPSPPPCPSSPRWPGPRRIDLCAHERNTWEGHQSDDRPARMGTVPGAAGSQAAGTSNQLSGTVGGSAVQGRSIHGGVHVHSGPGTACTR